jgi:hypothetical protein
MYLTELALLLADLQNLCLESNQKKASALAEPFLSKRPAV